MGSHTNQNTNEEPMLTNELISRYRQRLKSVFLHPNPYIKPIWEASEINQKIKELEKIIKWNR
jgi:hypothetical protein